MSLAASSYAVARPQASLCRRADARTRSVAHNEAGRLSQRRLRDLQQRAPGSGAVVVCNFDPSLAAPPGSGNRMSNRVEDFAPNFHVPFLRLDDEDHS